ncbi:MAG: aspartate aminotransferase family protein, partial [Cyclobacteriaceae bacterium]|nr:aspartate aminotransferase family protein [Cyclobacteriaceae bacterium]
IDSAQGIFLEGADGQKYLDLISGIGVSNVGHRHPKVVEAVEKQLKRHLHLMVYGEYIQSPQVKLAQAICATLPGQLDNVYLVNSGSEAVEGALKLAKRYTGKTGIVSCFNAYHGSSHGALSVCGNESLKQAYRPLIPAIGLIKYGKLDDLDRIDGYTAAVIVETIQGEAGVRAASQEYFKALRARCDEVGCLLILDEIQSGYGRTGKFWAFEHYDIIPDIVVCAKGMGGGMPIGAFIASHQVMQVLTHNPVLGHITTFGGHPLSAAAALATTRVVQEEKLISKVEAKAELFKEGLEHELILDIRHKGLMMAVEFESYEVLKPIIDEAIKLGIITDWFLFCDNAMRIAPPLTIENEQIVQACKKIMKAIDNSRGKI